MKLEKQDITQLNKFAENIGVEIENLLLLRESLTHRSFLNEIHDSGYSHNERLEFLGDAVLELLTTQFLFDKYPNRPEGTLTSFRAALVRTESLAEAADSLNYGEFIYMSKGEEATGGRKRPYILANTFEAVIGAVYLDQGIEVCDKFLHRSLFPKIDRIAENRLDIDAKSKLQELAQDLLRITPQYQLQSQSGPDHEKTFAMSVLVGDTEYGKGKGKSKQEAEQNAAKNALKDWDSLYKKHNNSAKIEPAKA